MTDITRIFCAAALGAVAGAWSSGCYAPPPPPAPTPVVQQAPVASQNNDDWNIFPDPTTGNVEIYHNGNYVGAVTGNEPEDPPMPHKVQE